MSNAGPSRDQGREAETGVNTPASDPRAIDPSAADDELINVWRTGGPFTTGIHALFGGAAGFMLFALMSVTMVDVVGRYVFNSPLPGGNEIVQILMAAIIYVALPSVCRQEAHITVDLLDGMTPDRAVPLRQIITNLLAFLILGFVCVCLWIKAEDLVEYGGTFEFLGWPHAPFAYGMSVLSGLAAAVFLANLLRYLRGARKPTPGFI